MSPVILIMNFLMGQAETLHTLFWSSQMGFRLRSQSPSYLTAIKGFWSRSF